MPRPSSKPVLLLCSVGVVLALVVGLIGSADRGPARQRAEPDFEAIERMAPEQSALVKPPVLAPVTDGPAPSAPSAVKTPAAPPAGVVVRGQELAHVTGFVLRPDGEPASRGRVVLGKQHARCDAQGFFEMSITGDVAGADLLAFEPGFEPSVRAAYGSGLLGGGEYQVRVLLGPETLTLSGTLVDGEGNGRKGWTVALDGLDLLESYGLRERVRTDGDGHFELTDVSAGAHVVRAWKDSPEAAVLSEPAAAGATEVRIVAE